MTAVSIAPALDAAIARMQKASRLSFGGKAKSPDESGLFNLAGHQGQIWALAHIRFTTPNFDETQVILGQQRLGWPTKNSRATCFYRGVDHVNGCLSTPPRTHL